MTAKERHFCRLVVQLGNQTEAYIQAYDHNGSRKTAAVEASRLMADGDIRAAVWAMEREVRSEVQSTTAVTKTWITEQLVAIVMKCMTHDQIMGKDGKPTGGTTWNPSAAVQALRLLGLELGMFTEKKIVEHSRFEGLTPEEKRRALELVEQVLAKAKAKGPA